MEEALRQPACDFHQGAEKEYEMRGLRSLGGKHSWSGNTPISQFLGHLSLKDPSSEEASSVHQNWWGRNYLFTVNVDNIFGSRIFFPQWGPFGILQKGHYWLRKRREKGKLILARKRGRWGNRGSFSFSFLETQVPGRDCMRYMGKCLGVAVPFYSPLISLLRALKRHLHQPHRDFSA